jgi:hypothetical protein
MKELNIYLSIQLKRKSENSSSETLRICYIHVCCIGLTCTRTCWHGLCVRACNLSVRGTHLSGRGEGEGEGGVGGGGVGEGGVSLQPFTGMVLITTAGRMDRAPRR